MTMSGMRSQLTTAIGHAHELLLEHLIRHGAYINPPPKGFAHRSNFDSLVINRRKPHTYRAFCYPDIPELKGTRICLHRFEPCSEDEAFLHPHPWPSAMMILKGQYRMRVGCSPDMASKPVMVMDTVLSAGSVYVMEEPKGWHSVQPITTCWSIMVNGQPWGDKAHEEAPTTKGKDLQKMTPDELNEHLMKFDAMLEAVIRDPS